MVIQSTSTSMVIGMVIESTSMVIERASTSTSID